jgi:LAO/AO transport system kinase
MNQLSKDISEDILNGSKVALSKAITLTESTLPYDKILSQEIIDVLLPFTGNSIRIGVTGVTGVGKSTFIDSFGMYLCNLKRKVAVLAVDPSSVTNKGSILGDKTRMQNLSKIDSAYIRPSPSGKALGGVTETTRNVILLCEAAGFDTIIVETVGVGQSEVSVKNMTDFFLLLMLAGAGDELQGMKRGIMEMADAIFINKADGGNIDSAKQAAQLYNMALQLFPNSESGWKPKAEVCSAITNLGIDTCWKLISDFEVQMKRTNYFNKNRKQQELIAFRETFRYSIVDKLMNNTLFKEKIEKTENDISENKISVSNAVQSILYEVNFLIN